MILSKIRPRLALLVLSVSILAPLTWLGAGIWQTRAALTHFAQALDDVSAHVESGEIRRAQADLRRAQRHAADAAASSSGPLWWAARGLPLLGDDFKAVETVTNASRS